MFEHLRNCIIGQRPELLPAGECFGGCACKCHALWAGVGNENLELLGLLKSMWTISPRE
jgi:hypothetical protein